MTSMTASVDPESRWKDLYGVWYNQLGSKMTLTAEWGGGPSGKYHSNVGGVLHDYFLAGIFDPSSKSWTNDPVGFTLGWAVTYIYDKSPVHIHSTATWSGQFFNDSNSDDDGKIITQWLLTRSTKKGDIWNSTTVGNDAFTRTKPTAAEIAKARALGGSSPDDIILACVNQGSE